MDNTHKKRKEKKREREECVTLSSYPSSPFESAKKKSDAFDIA